MYVSLSLDTHTYIHTYTYTQGLTAKDRRMCSTRETCMSIHTQILTHSYIHIGSHRQGFTYVLNQGNMYVSLSSICLAQLTPYCTHIHTYTYTQGLTAKDSRMYSTRETCMSLEAASASARGCPSARSSLSDWMLAGGMYVCVYVYVCI
jgi:hypothetical protein